MKFGVLLGDVIVASVSGAFEFYFNESRFSHLVISSSPLRYELAHNIVFEWCVSSVGTCVLRFKKESGTIDLPHIGYFLQLNQVSVSQAYGSVCLE